MADAEVFVIANHTTETVPFQLPAVPGKAVARAGKLPPGVCIPVVIAGPTQLTFEAGGQIKHWQVQPLGMYFFGRTKEGELDLSEIGLTMSKQTRLDLADVAPVDEKISLSPSPVVIPIKLVYDDAEVTPRDAWEKKMRARFDEVSRIFKRQCFVEFKIVAVEDWRADHRQDGLEELLSQFEKDISPAPARLAVGFSGRKVRLPADRHLGGTRGPLHTHLLMREWANKNSEAERLEVLVHELGHFLGAVHSPEPDSVMRPKLGDRQARGASFRIGFDALNTLAMCLVSEGMRGGPISDLDQLAGTSQVQLIRVYNDLVHAMPNDPTALRYLARLVPAAVPEQSGGGK